MVSFVPGFLNSEYRTPPSAARQLQLARAASSNHHLQRATDCFCVRRREHPAEEVFVTGSFDDWGKTVKLEKNSSGVFEKTVELPKSDENVYYKVRRIRLCLRRTPGPNSRQGKRQCRAEPPDMSSCCLPDPFPPCRMSFAASGLVLRADLFLTIYSLSKTASG